MSGNGPVILLIALVISGCLLALIGFKNRNKP